MRKQVLVPLMAFGMLAVIALVAFAGEALSASRTQELTIARSTVVDHIVRQATQAAVAGDNTTLARYLARFGEVYGESVVVVDSLGAPLASTGDLDPESPAVAALIVAATSNLPRWDIPTVRPWSPDTVLVAEPILAPGEASAGAVVLEIQLADARADVTRDWTIVGIVGLAFLLGLGLASLWWTRWVLRPVQALDAAANAFPAHTDAAALTTGPPELRQLSASFTRMADGVERTLEQQRSFVADASHQLRNPLAAIRLRVDAVAPDLDQGTTAALEGDLDRLERTVDRMLALADAEHRAIAAESGTSAIANESRRDHTVANAAALVEPFLPLLTDAGITVRVEGEEPVRIACRRSDLEEIVGTLLDNGIRYAGKGATVTVGLLQRGSSALVTVADDGPGLTEAELELAGTRFWRGSQQQQVPGTGLGLAIVREIAKSAGGTVRLSRADSGGLQVTVTFGVVA